MLSFLMLLKDSGQKYLYFFDDQTTDRQLKRQWRKALRDPTLCFSRRDYDVLCERLAEHHKQDEQGTQIVLEEEDLGKLLDGDDDEYHGR